VEAAVGELPHVPQRQRAEDLELAHPREVEERVAVEHRYEPEPDPERDAGRNDRELASTDPALDRLERERERGHGDRAQQCQRQPERPMHREGDGERRQQRGE
jgi:hypothetical protein